MRSRIGQSEVSDEDLQMYFDGELTGADAHELKSLVEAEPELRAELEQMGVLRELISHSMERRAKEVPTARFEQIWDEIDRAIDREERQRGSATQPAPESIWTRIWIALKPVRYPALAAAAAAVVAVVVMRPGADDGAGRPNKAEGVASVPEATGDKAPGSKAPKPAMPEPTEIAHAPENPPEDDFDFPEPKAGKVDIHRVEFGGQFGRIQSNGVTTVLMVEESTEPEKSERSL